MDKLEGVLVRKPQDTSGIKGFYCLRWVPRASWTGVFIVKHLENHKPFEDPDQAWCSFFALTFCVACSLTSYDFLTTSCSSPLTLKKKTIKTLAVLSEQKDGLRLSRSFTPSIGTGNKVPPSQSPFRTSCHQKKRKTNCDNRTTYFKKKLTILAQ